MRNILLFLSLFIISVSSLIADLEPGSIPSEEIRNEDYQKVAKFFGKQILPDGKRNGEENRLITYQKDPSTGTIYHIGWYADGYIVTQLNGSLKGLQTVVGTSEVNGEVIGMAFPNRAEGSIKHIYPWGQVITNPAYQDVYIEGVIYN